MLVVCLLRADSFLILKQLLFVRDMVSELIIVHMWICGDIEKLNHISGYLKRFANDQ